MNFRRMKLDVFSKICELMNSGGHLSVDGIRAIVHLRNRMNNETSKRHREDSEILSSLS